MKAQKAIEFVLKGCKCKTGCITRKCKCRKNHGKCGPGCQCTGCTNVHADAPPTTDETTEALHCMEVEENIEEETSELHEMVETSDEENEIEDEDDVNDLIRAVFGDSDDDDV